MPVSFGLTSSLAIDQNLTVGGTATVASSLTLSGTTASALLYGNASKAVASVTLSSNLSLTTGTLALAAALTGINSVTSAAGQPLVLATGTSGTALSIASATNIATFSAGVTGTSLTLSSLTSSRVPFATTAGLLTDASTLTFSAGTLTASAYVGTSLTAPAATDLTLAGGSSGAGLVLGQGVNSDATLTPSGNGQSIFQTTYAGGDTARLKNNSASGYSTLAFYSNSGTNSGAIGWGNTSAATFADSLVIFSKTSSNIVIAAGASEKARITSTGNLLIGTTTDAASLAGGLVINGSGAGATTSSTTTGALRITGGAGITGNINAGGTGTFGSDVSITRANPAATSGFRTNNQSADGYADIAVINSGASGRSFSIGSAGSTVGISALQSKFYIYDNTGTAARLTIDSAGTLNLPTTTEATTSAGIGALTTAGGIHAAKRIVSDSTEASMSSTTGSGIFAGGIYAGENSVFAGDRLLARKDQNSVTRLQVRNDTSGTAAQSQVSATLGDFTTYTAMGSLSAGFTTSGLFAANAGYIASNASAGMNLFTVGATSLTFGTNSAAALTLASGGAATFAGAVTGNSSITAAGLISSTNLTLTAASNARIYWNGGQTAWTDYNGTTYTFRDSGGNTPLTIDTAGITVAGSSVLSGVLTTSSATLSGAGAIPITTSLVKFTSTGAAQALTLANGVDGQRLTIVHDVDGGSGILTPTTKTGFSTVTFTNAGDTVSLVYVTTRGWMVTGSYLAVIAP